MINNWLGFISTCNCPCPDTNDLNLIEIEITLADEKVLWCSRDSGGADHGAVAPVNAGFALENIHFTISKIVFNDPLYYNLKASKLLSSGLTIGYQTYITSKSAAVTKQSSVNVLTTVNSTSLDQLICCLQPSDPQIYPLQLSGSNSAATFSTFDSKDVLYSRDKQTHYLIILLLVIYIINLFTSKVMRLVS
jgi:hypothetical protein